MSKTVQLKSGVTLTGTDAQDYGNVDTQKILARPGVAAVSPSPVVPDIGPAAAPRVNPQAPIEAAKLGTPSIVPPPPVANTAARTGLAATVASTADQMYTGQQQELAAAQAAPAPQVNSRQSVLDRIMESMNKLGDKGQRTLQIQEKEGVQEKKTLARNLENQYLSKTRAYDNLIENRRKNASGSFGGAVEQDIAEIERKKNSELADIAIQYKVASGAYAEAFEIAQAKVEAEFEPLQNEIDTLTKYYQLSADDMTESEKLEAQSVIEDKRANLQFEKQKELARFNQELGMSDPKYLLELEQLGLENEKMGIENGQLAGLGDGVSPEIAAYAQQYASTGTIPTGLPKGTFGQVSQLAKELPKTPGAIVNAQTGVKDASVGEAEQQDYGRLYNILNNVQRMKQYDDKRSGGVIGGSLAALFGQDAATDFMYMRKAIVDDMQRMQSGAALTPEEIRTYEGYLPGRFTDKKGGNLLFEDSNKRLESFEGFIMNRLKERLSASGLTMYGFSTVNVGGKEYKVGEKIEGPTGAGVVLPDGSISVPEKTSFNSVGNTKASPTALSAAFSLIAKEEGLRTEAYQDQTGKWTIGFGNTMINGRPVRPGDRITKEQAASLMKNSVVKNYTNFARVVGSALPPNKFAALTSFEYNLGPGIWKDPTAKRILSLVRGGKYGDAGRLMLQFNKSRDPSSGQLKINPVLAKRRQREAKLLLS